jgi:alpha-2-macroglobulin
VVPSEGEATAQSREGAVSLGKGFESAEVTAARQGLVAAGPFRVLFAGPSGDDLDSPQPQIVFSRPVRALGAVDGPDLGARFSPEIPGRWEWTGTSAARFVPTTPFVLATTYRLELPAGLRSTDGSTLTEKTSLTFSTQRPAVALSPGSAGDASFDDLPTPVSRRDAVSIYFRGGVRRADLERHMRVVGRDGRALPFHLALPHAETEETRREDDGIAREIRVVPNDRWPESESVAIHFDGEIHGDPRMGPLPMRPTVLHFATAEPSRVESLTCSERGDGRCRLIGDGGYLTVELSDEMRRTDFLRLVTIEPPTKIKPADRSDDRPRTYHEIEFEPEPNVRYTVRIKPSVGAPRQDPKKTAKELLPLKIGKEASFVFAPDDSGVRFSFSGTYLLPGSGPENDELAAKAEDTSAARAFVLPLTRELVMAAERERLAAGHRGAEPTDGPFLWEKAPAKVKVLAVRASPAAPPTWLSLSNEVPPGISGPVLFGARWRGLEADETSEQILQRSELALLTKTSSEGALVWVTSLRTGDPLPGVAVEARDYFERVVRAVTDQDGVARLDTSDLGVRSDKSNTRDLLRNRATIFAQRGDDWVYQTVFLPEKPPHHGALFTDRGLYRPGETTNLEGVVRRSTSEGLRPEVDKTVDLTIETPDGRTLAATGRLGPFGTYTTEVVHPADASLGFYNVHAKLDGEWVGHSSFRVMEYKPSSFSVVGTFDKSAYQRGDTATCSAKGAYLYGGSLRGAKVDFHLRRSDASYALPQVPGFTVNQHNSGRLPEGVAHSGTLDEHGVAAFAVPLENAGQLGPELVTCEILATDAGHDTVGATSSALVHPAEVYAALEKKYRGVVAPGQRLEPKVLAVRPDGTRENRPVKLSLFVLRRDPKKSWLTLPVGPTPAASCVARPSHEPASCVLVAPPGPYDGVSRFELQASVVDDKGHEARTTEVLYPGTPAKVSKQLPARPVPHVTLTADKESYAVGEQARLTTTSPFERGHLLLTVESEGISSHFVRPIGRDPLAIDLPVDAAIAPQVRVDATVVAPFADDLLSYHASSATTVVKSPYEAHALTVTLTPNKAVALPGEEIEIELDVHKSDGTPAEASVTLYGADEGTLLLAKYALPDPLADFFRYRPHTISTAHTRHSLAYLHDWKEELRQFGLGNIGAIGHGGGGTGSGQGFGSGGGRLGGASTNRRSDPRRDMRQTAFFFPALPTDAQGHIKQRVRLPDAVTTYRLMAFAVTKPGDMGHAQAPVITQMPVQVRPSLPRVIRRGDKFQVAAMVANNDAVASHSCVASVRLDGRSLVARGPVTRPITLPPLGSARLLFDVEATEVLAVDAGAAITTTLACGESGDAAESPYSVENPVVLDASSAFGLTSGRVDQPLANLDDVNKSVGELELTLSASPLAGLATGLEQLVNYPYGCVEQTTSRLVPLLSLRELARALNVKLPDDLETATRAAVARVEAAQQKDGGFGLWPDSDGSSPWLSAYATWGLEEARRHYVPANAAALDRARRHLLDGLAATGDSPAERAAAPFALDVLAGAAQSSPGSVDPGSLRVIADQWFERRDRLPIFSRALLLHAMASLESDRAQLDKLVNELSSEIHVDGPVARYVTTDPFDDASFDSGVRTSALVLRALLAAAPEHPLLTPLALGLVADRRGGTWRTTQEAAWALLALDAYRQKAARTGVDPLVGGLVKWGGEPLLQAQFGASPGSIPPDQRTTIPLAKLLALGGASSTSTLSFEAIGGGAAPLYYQAVLRTAPATLPVEGRMSGFEIHRTYRVVPSGSATRAAAYQEMAAAPADQPIREGDLVLVRIDVVASSRRRFVVIDDPLPGGFETVDPTLQGGPRWLRGVLTHAGGGTTRVEHHDDRVLFFADDLAPGGYSFQHLVRATTAGTFVTPPTRVEEMYTPDTFGRTGARSVVVAPL